MLSAIQEQLTIGTRTVPLLFQRNLRARRYVLRVRPDGHARVTIPRGGSRQAALDFARRHLAWIEHQLEKRAIEAARPKTWSPGAEVLYRGEWVKLLRVDGTPAAAHDWIQLGDQLIPTPAQVTDYRRYIERRLRQLAAQELPPRVHELAALFQAPVKRVSIRNQRTRYGSCSVHGTISLNWRLVQMPPSVRDYLILHELMHIREMNHSARFWQLVETACPQYAQAEAWLKNNHLGLRGQPRPS